MYTILWEFLVPPQRRAEFERAYARGRAVGRAVRPGRRLRSAIELLRCTEQDGRYLTVDRWRSPADLAPSNGTSAPSTPRWTAGWRASPRSRPGSAPFDDRAAR